MTFTGTLRVELLRAVLCPVLLIALVILPGRALGQVSRLPAPAPQEERATLPETLSPEAVDTALARLTDAEIRDLLRRELVRRAEENAADERTERSAVEALVMRASAMRDTIAERLPRWARAVANITERLPTVRERLASASRGIAGMLGAAFVVVAASLIAAVAVAHLLRQPRQWLLTSGRQPYSYGERVVRSLALATLELAPVVAFVVATRAVAPFWTAPLGPLNGMVWIYHAGVSAGWVFLIAARRAFAPDAPAIRIAPLSDDEAWALHRLLRQVTVIGVAGWLIAGLFPNLGFGFPPALLTVAAAGTAVTVVLALAVWRRARAVSRRIAALLTPAGTEPTTTGRIIGQAAPVLFGLYLLGAWLYWLGHWLERGQHQLAGPIGSLLVLLAVPLVDRMGVEAIRAAIRAPSDTAERFRLVLLGAWRILIGTLAVYAILRLWGLDLLAFAKGPGAPGWASTAFDITVTLLLGYLAWRLIRAALHTEKQAAGDGEDADPLAPPASRLDTLTPLFRGMLVAFLATLVVMIVLSSLGVDIGPLLASAGILGIAIGFGAQTLVRDIFSGIFFLIDDAFRVGEYIELDPDLRGTVEAMSIRSLQLRHHRGPVITVPFGELKQVTNHTRDWVIYKMSFRLEPDTDPQQVKKIVKRVGQEFLEHPEHGPKFIEPLKSQGVHSIDDDSALVIRVKFKCIPKAQFVLRREIYHRLRAVFAENGITFARRKVEVVGAPSPAAAVEALDAQRA